MEPWWSESTVVVGATRVSEADLEGMPAVTKTTLGSTPTCPANRVHCSTVIYSTLFIPSAAARAGFCILENSCLCYSLCMDGLDVTRLSSILLSVASPILCNVLPMSIYNIIPCSFQESTHFSGIICGDVWLQSVLARKLCQGEVGLCCCLPRRILTAWRCALQDL